MEALNTPESIAKLRAEVLNLQGFKPSDGAPPDVGLGPIKYSFPNNTFPLGALHEFVSHRKEDTASTTGFVSGLISSLIKNGVALWISNSRMLFPPGLKSFGVQPECFIFVYVQKEKDALWTLDEALKCNALRVVVAELQELSFNASRRLQLAVEQSRVTGFILRNNPRMTNPTACASRWKITSLPSDPIKGLPGIGFPTWRVELLRVKNGKPGVWNFKWANGKFEPVDEQSTIILEQYQKKAG
jgi:protein ImuA